jgi:hypothetical protein
MDHDQMRVRLQVEDTERQSIGSEGGCHFCAPYHQQYRRSAENCAAPLTVHAMRTKIQCLESNGDL